MGGRTDRRTILSQPINKSTTMVCTLIGNSSRPISARRPLSYCKNFVEKTNKPKLLAVDRLIATTTKHIYNPHSNNTPI